MAGGVRRPVKGQFFASRREANAKVFFDQTEMVVVMAKENSGVCAFSELKLSHSNGLK